MVWVDVREVDARDRVRGALGELLFRVAVLLNDADILVSVSLQGLPLLPRAAELGPLGAVDLLLVRHAGSPLREKRAGRHVLPRLVHHLRFVDEVTLRRFYRPHAVPDGGEEHAEHP